LANKKIAKEVEKRASPERRKKEAIKARLLQRKKENKDQTKKKIVRVSCELLCYSRI
jgi:hypothetical protein